MYFARGVLFLCCDFAVKLCSYGGGTLWYDEGKRGGIAMANRRKYTSPAALRAAVEAYLNSIRVRNVVYKLDSRGEYVRDADGDKIAERDANGNAMFIESYAVPPELHDIADAVGMSYDTWLKYASGEYDTDRKRFSEVCADAKEVCLRWALREMHTRHKGVEGIKWSLQVNYGMREKTEVELGADTRKALAASSLTTEEKLSAIASMPELAALFNPDGGDDE